MKNLYLIVFTLFISACSSTTTYKAKSLGWSKVLEAKTRSLAETDCKDHLGYYSSVQNTMWGNWSNNIRWYESVELICADGFTITYPIKTVEAHYSQTVANILTKELKDNL